MNYDQPNSLTSLLQAGRLLICFNFKIIGILKSFTKHFGQFTKTNLLSSNGILQCCGNPTCVLVI